MCTDLYSSILIIYIGRKNNKIGLRRIPPYTRGETTCLEEVGIPCQPVTISRKNHSRSVDDAFSSTVLFQILNKRIYVMNFNNLFSYKVHSVFNNTSNKSTVYISTTAYIRSNCNNLCESNKAIFFLIHLHVSIFFVHL